MAIDERYQDNLVLKKDAFQNLLTGIKNYPIIDIDYVVEDEVDELHNDTVWPNYTGGMPCIKITYGDARTTKGNVIFKDANKGKIAAAKKEIVRLTSLQTEWERRKNRWIDAFNLNKEIYQSKTAQIEAMANTLNKMDLDRYNFLILAFNTLSYWSRFESNLNWSSYLWLTKNANGDYEIKPSTETITVTYPNIFDYKTWQTKNAKNEKVTIQCRFLSNEDPNYVQTSLIGLLKSIAIHVFNCKVEIVDGVEVITPIDTDYQDKADLYNTFIDFVSYYNQLVFLDGLNIAGIQDAFEEFAANYEDNVDDFRANANLRFGIPLDVLEYFDYTIYNPSYNYTTTVSMVKNKINDVLGTLKNYVANNMTACQDKIKEIDKNLTWLETLTRTENDWNTQLAMISNDDKKKVPTANTGKAAVFYETEYYSIADYNYFIDYWNDEILNAAKNVVGEDGEPHDRTMYGYKYVKVGSNITFDDTYFTNKSPWNVGKNKTAELLEKTDTADKQASGTYRITINGHVYEVPIKGFTETESNQDIFIKTTFNAANGTGNNINFQGNVTGAGNIVTNNGNIFASGGAVGAATYQALRGYYEGIGTNYGSTNTAGFWYDGSNNILRTWDISNDKNLAGFGTHTISLIAKTASGDKGYDDNAAQVGIQNNGGVLEVVGLPNNSGTFHGLKCSNLTTTAAANIGTNLTVGGNTNISGNLSIGSESNPKNLVINGRTLQISHIPNSISDTAHFWRGDATWNNTLTGNFILSSDAGATGNYQPTDANPSNTAGAVFRCSGSGWFGRNLTANKVFNAVFNDYAECRQTIDLEAGRVVVDNDDGSLSCATKRLQPGAQVISDTWGHIMGETDKCKTPLAVAGRVLVYTYQACESYHAGMAVCSAPNGTVDIMTREEIREYPDCIVGIVSEIPQYETWGSDDIKVNGRIWIKVK